MTPNRGVILLVVLWLLVILSAMAIGFGHTMLVEYRIAANDISRMKNMQLAKSGIEWSIALLASDSTERGTLTGKLRLPEENFNQVACGEGTYTLFIENRTDENKTEYGLMDENSKININSASKETLMKLPGVDEIIADSIIDWRSATAKASALGAKDEYYSQLSTPYLCKNAPFDTIEEILLVKGMTPALLYGEDANLNGVLDPNENDGDGSFPPDNSDGTLDKGMYPYITVYSYDWNQAFDGTKRININQARQNDLRQLSNYGLTNSDISNIISARRNRQFQTIADLLDVNGITNAKFGAIADYITTSQREKLIGLVNVNTAPREVLLAIPGIDETAADKIIERRIGAEGPFTDLGQVASAIGKASMKKASDSITLRSSQFTIQSVGALSGRQGKVRLMAVVDRSVIPIQYLYFRDISYLGAGL